MWNICVLSHVCMLDYLPVCLHVCVCVRRSMGSASVGGFECVFVCASGLKIHSVSCVLTHLITFGLLQEDKALVSLLIKTSLAKVTDWETGTAECVCVCVYMPACMFSFLCPLGQH